MFLCLNVALSSLSILYIIHSTFYWCYLYLYLQTWNDLRLVLELMGYCTLVNRMESVCSSTCKAEGFCSTSSSSHTLSVSSSTPPHRSSAALFPTQNCLISGTLKSLKTAGVTRSTVSLSSWAKAKVLFQSSFFRVEWIQRRSSASEHLFHSRDTKTLTSVQNKLRSCASNVHLPNPLQLGMNTSFFSFC